MDEPCRDEICLTCRDDARPGQVLTPPGDAWQLAQVRTDTGVEEVDVSLVGEVVPGDRVLVHAGTAIGRLEQGGEV
ncbi:MAG: HypC/HybG/HupF family hydrogenase formation chaperone [Bifidobacteriaceae bacterium]|nr:HypC/HybG/HupF family hydrogenase formation chaperone [Bifidobacteriaceae bacterium]